jgi:hypothetical protein
MTRKSQVEVAASAPRELPPSSSWKSGRPEWLTPAERGATQGAKWPKASRPEKASAPDEEQSEVGAT